MSIKSYFAILCTALVIMACDDNTSTLGMDMMPTTDLVQKTYQTYDVTTSSNEVGDSVLARTSVSYLGKYTDPVTGSTIKSDFLSQFHSLDGGKLFPEDIADTAVAATIVLNINSFVGDSLTNMKIDVYELDSLLDPNADYYTNIDPSKYIKKGAKPVGTKWFTACDKTLKDTTRWNTSNYTNHVTINIDKAIADDIVKGYHRDSTIFSSNSNWLKSGLRGSKGFYFKLSKGDGVMASIKYSTFNVYYGRTSNDSTYQTSFGGTEEVVQATRFENKNIDKLMSDKEATYLKSPAGIFTLAELPIDSISVNDTINSASITFTRYNDSAYSLASSQSNFRLGIPKTVLMVRLDDYLNGFFEKYETTDNITSFTTTFSSSDNTYEFSNISRLITTMLNEKKNGTATKNYNKVLLIPVETTTNSQSAIVKINHDFSMSSARLVGGEKDKVKMTVIYSKFNTTK